MLPSENSRRGIVAVSFDGFYILVGSNLCFLSENSKTGIAAVSCDSFKLKLSSEHCFTDIRKL